MPRKPNRPPAPQVMPPADPAPSSEAALEVVEPPAVNAAGAPPPADPVAGEPLLEHGQPMLEPLTAYELAPKVLLAPDGGGDRAFAANLDATVKDFGSTRNAVRVCEWCNTPLPDPDAAQCPTCGANLKPLEPDAEIPGLTTMTLEAELARRRAEAQQQATSNAGGGILRSAGSILGGARAVPPSTPAAVTQESLDLDDATIEEAIRPPDDSVRRAMRQLEIEALQAQAPGVVPGGLDPAAVAADAGSATEPDETAGAPDHAVDASPGATAAAPPPAV
jgi:hypothetical protein